MNKLKFFIITLIILIIILLSMLYYFTSIDSNNNITQGDPGLMIEYDSSKIEIVESKSEFFTVVSCINTFFDVINNNSSGYYGRDDNNNYVRITSDEQINQLRINLLSDEYIEKNNITVNNISRYIDKIDESVMFIPLEMRKIGGISIDNYIAYGYIIDISNNYIKDVYMRINMDKNNRTFSVEPIQNENISIDDIRFVYNEEVIEEKENNKYRIRQMNYEDIAKEYFSMYKKIVISNVEVMYNLLDDEYKEKRFGNIEEFKRYVNTNKDEITSAQMVSYLVNIRDGYTEFVCRDNNDNLYIFKDTSPMKFKLELDEYTIISDKFKSEYDRSNEQYRVMMNIDKWVMMLNNRDYKTAYNLLDETFRKNTFGTVENFEINMKNIFPSYYDVTYNNFSKERDINMQTITLKDRNSGSTIGREMSIIMQLKENYDFVMSFGIE